MMRSYVRGKIQSLMPSQLIIETNGIGYQFIIFHYDLFPQSGETIVYEISVTSEFENQVYGFPNLALRDWFSDLVSIKSVGPKTAALILNAFNLETWKLLIKNQDLEQLLTIKGIGNYTSKLILKNLNSKYFGFELNETQNAVLMAFTKIGYQQKLIYPLIKQSRSDFDVEALTYAVWKKISKIDSN